MGPGRSMEWLGAGNGAHDSASEAVQPGTVQQNHAVPWVADDGRWAEPAKQARDGSESGVTGVRDGQVTLYM